MKSVLALLADIANGIFAVYIASYVVGTEIQAWHFLIGIGFAMLPDIDALGELWRRGKVGAHRNQLIDHREYLHIPLAYVLVGGLAIVAFGYWGWVFLIASFLHFVNDLYGTGWGVSLWQPFNNRRYKILGRRVNILKSELVAARQWETLNEDDRKLRLIVTWELTELPDFIRSYGQENWIERTYLNLNWISGTEYVLFGVSVVLLLSSLFTW